LNNKLLKSLADFISVLTIPTNTSFLLFLVLGFEFKSSIQNLNLYFLISFLFLNLIQIIWVFVLFKLKLIDDWQVENREQRHYLYIGAVVIYLIGYILLLQVTNNKIIILSWLAYLLTTILVYIINLFWKISIHSIGAIGATTILLIIYGNKIFPLILLPLAVGWARLYLRKHTLLQVLGGYFLGFLLVKILFNIF
jgi:membrane-associated phospholipid phosphatase